MLNKIVNGVEVECSAAEEAEILAEWEANEKLAPVVQPMTAPDLFAALQAKGLLTREDVVAVEAIPTVSKG